MEAIGFAFGVLGPLESLVRDLKNRVQNHKQAPGKLEDIAIRFQSSHESLSSLKGMVEQGWPEGFPQASKDICQKETLRISELVSSCEKRIETLKGRFPGDANMGLWTRSYIKLKQVPKTNRFMAELDDLDAESKQIEEYVRNLNSLLAKTYQTADLLHPKADRTDKFATIFKVPCLSGFEVLDFNSLETPEGRLKDLLLNSGTASEHVTAALGGAERKIPLSGLVGMGGVGKTSALIGLGYDEAFVVGFLAVFIF